MQKTLILDTETGGLDASQQSILSLAGVVLDNHKLVAEIEVYIAEPNIVAQQTALDINGIDIEWLRNAGMKPQAAVITFDAFLTKHFGKRKVPYGGQNVCFDQGFLKRLYKLASDQTRTRCASQSPLPFTNYESRFSHRTQDTMHVMRFLGEAGALPFNTGSLDDAIAYFGIDTTGDKPHTALGDARRTAKVLSALMKSTNFTLKGATL